MAKIEKGRPLPSHTKLDYDECYAKIVLEGCFPELYDNLIIDDKPDLQSFAKDIGVEVTRAEESKAIEAQNLWFKLPHTDGIKKQKILKRIEECGAKHENGVFTNRPGKDNFDLINKSIERKNQKLQNSGYATCKEYQLFIFSLIYADDFMLQEELAFLQNTHVEKYWKKIYVSVPKSLYCFDLESAACKVVSLDSKKQSKFARQAHAMVEKGEQDDET